MKIQARHWMVLMMLVAVWGSSYLMIEVALRAWRPAEITGIRIAMAAVVLLVALWVRRERLPTGGRHWAFFVAIALIGNCAPFFLISWGQQQVESGLAGILAASTPLFVLVLAHVFLEDEPMHRRHVCAFVLGFAGIVVLMGPDSLAALGGSTPRLWSQLAILAGAVCYAAATVIARKMPPASSLVTSAGVMLAASFVMSGFMWDGITVIDQVSWQAAGAIGFLGLLGTGVASILYFHLLSRTSARFTSLLNFLVPVWAVCLGAVWLGESLPLSAWFGLVLVLGSLILTSNSMMIPLPGKKRR